MKGVRDLDRFERALEGEPWQWRVLGGSPSADVDVYVPSANLLIKNGAMASVRRLVRASGVGGTVDSAEVSAEVLVEETPESRLWEHRWSKRRTGTIAAAGGLLTVGSAFVSGAVTLDAPLWALFFPLSLAGGVAVRTWVERTRGTRAALRTQSLLVGLLIAAPAFGEIVLRRSEGLALLLLIMMGLIGCGVLARTTSGLVVVGGILSAVAVVVSAPLGVGRLISVFYLGAFDVGAGDAGLDWTTEFAAGFPEVVGASGFLILLMGSIGWLRTLHYPVPVLPFLCLGMVVLLGLGALRVEYAARAGQEAVGYFVGGGTDLDAVGRFDLKVACIRLREGIDASAGLPVPARPVLYFVSSDDKYTLWDPAQGRLLEPSLKGDALNVHRVQHLGEKCTS
ncbi:hypothetical protein GCM10027589_12540 [Actinocorallia lasiicapitis]